MNELVQYLLMVNLYIALVGTFFLFIRWLMKKLNCQQTTIYQLWIIFPIGMLLLLVFQLTDTTLSDVTHYELLVLPTIQVSSLSLNKSISMVMLTCFIWLLVSSIFVIQLIYKYLLFKKVLNKEVKILSKNIRESAIVTSPLAFGLLNPKVYMALNSHEKLNHKQQLLIIEHELIHCRRYDPMIRMIYKIIEVLFWMNPIIYIINSKVKYDQETSVDQILLNKYSQKFNSINFEYSKLLLKVNQNSIFNNSFQLPEIYCSSTSMLKERIMLIKKNQPSVNNFKNKLSSVLLITTAIATTVLTTSSLANNNQSDSQRITIPAPPKAPSNAKPTNPPKPPKAKLKNTIGKVNGTDIQIVPIAKFAPYYPRKAVDGNISGYVTMDVDISTNGTVEDVRVVESEPPGIFDKEAVNSLMKYKFEPIAQPVTIQQKVKFELD